MVDLNANEAFLQAGNIPAQAIGYDEAQERGKSLLVREARVSKQLNEVLANELVLPAFHSAYERRALMSYLDE